ncbi:MAG TPA: protein kinase [Pyrinomonadaceae bacterium]|nr:protein kinase [Pyrinomonadaceae bacterium]
MAPGTISHYRIIRRLGRGGMGEVFLAEDTKLGRRLALKLLLAEYTRDPSRLLRFEREARAASSLNHPGILTVYEIGESEGRHFIATEFVDGETLRHKIKRSPLAPAEAVRTACQMAEALAAAHEAGVVHRDVKPENVMVRRDGYVKVLDFGLAKLVEQRRETGSVEEAATVQMARTSPGAVMGTVWYMSPEQARGEVVDERTDVWALGCVLYEMLAGLPPFTGETASHVTVSILEKEPPSIAESLGAAAPPELERVLSKALAKDRAARYRTAAEMLEDLRLLASSPGVINASAAPPPKRGANGAQHTFARGASETLHEATGTQAGAPTRRTGGQTRLETIAPALMRPGTRAIVAAVVAAVLLTGGFVVYKRRWAAPRIDAVAVLPFANVGGSPDTEWLSDGITESLINSLSPAAGLKVMSRNSVFRYKGRDIEPGQIGRELGVGAVLAGQVAQRGEDLTVSVELIDARDNTHIWGDKYERKLSDALKVQEEIARQIASRLRSRLGGESGGGKHYTESGEAYQDYLRGRYFWNKRTEEGFRKAVQFFDRAIEHDPRYALAHAGLADTYALMSDYSIVPPREAMPKARAAAEEALAIDDSLAEAHTSRAFVRMAYEWKWAEAEQDFRRALELNPNYATAHQWYASYLLQVGRFGEALSEIKQAQELDPLSPIIGANAGLYHYYARQYAEAEERLRRTLEVDDRFGVAHLYMGYVYLQQPARAQEAVAEFQRAAEYMGEDPETLAALGHALAVTGRRAEAQKILERLRERASRGYVSPYFTALVHLGLGDRERAFESLERAYDDRHPGMILIKSDPRFDPLRRDPRFSRLVRRVEQPS